MKALTFAMPLLTASLLLSAGCAKQQTTPPAPSPLPQLTSGHIAPSAPAKAGGNVHVSDELARACAIDFNNVGSAPKFDFDKSALLPQDRDVLAQVARCVTTGPMKGRALELVGRADPRGEAEYNMVLGEHRAGSAEEYLAQLGVERGKLQETSRGKLDATGTDEAGWRLDRRVDILLR